MINITIGKKKSGEHVEIHPRDLDMCDDRPNDCYTDGRMYWKESCVPEVPFITSDDDDGSIQVHILECDSDYLDADIIAPSLNSICPLEFYGSYNVPMSGCAVGASCPLFIDEAWRQQFFTCSQTRCFEGHELVDCDAEDETPTVISPAPSFRPTVGVVEDGSPKNHSSGSSRQNSFMVSAFGSGKEAAFPVLILSAVGVALLIIAALFYYKRKETGVRRKADKVYVEG